MVDKAVPVGFLCNKEVLDFVREVKKNTDKVKRSGMLTAKENKGKQRLATVAYEVVRYLENSPSANQTTEEITKFMLAVKSSELSKIEKLQFVNLVPQAPVDVHLLVKDCETRLSEERIPELIGLVTESFPGCKKEDATEEEEEPREEAHADLVNANGEIDDDGDEAEGVDIKNELDSE
jgi:hypothetical protein